MKSYFANRKIRSPHGFTLIELLVVIAIIAILAAILFPVFAKAREKAYQSQCMNNQRQIAIGILSYAQDNDEALPLPSNWVDACGLSADPKVFNCPSLSHDGRPGDPDYGMNAFLYDLDLNTGESVGAALGSFEDPTVIELTTDLKMMTPAGSTDVDPDRAQGIDQSTNPFPKSYTVNGFASANTGAIRHSGAAIVTFVDGHVEMVKGLNLGNGKTGYSIPRGGFRFYVDFNSCADATEAQRRLNTYVNLVHSSGWTFNAGSKTLDLAAGGVLYFNSDSYWNDPACYGNATNVMDSFMIDAKISEGGKFSFGMFKSTQFGVPFPTTDVDHAQLSDHNAVTINTATGADFAQIGQLYGFSQYAYAGYTPGTWITLPVNLRGERKPIPASASKFIVSGDVHYGLPDLPKFPTDSSATYWVADNTMGNANSYYWGVLRRSQAKVTVKALDGGGAFMTADVPTMTITYNTSMNRQIRAVDGTLQINKILYNSSGSM